VTTHHVASLLIAALLFLVCEFSGKCSEKMIDHASQLSMTIAVATFAHAQGNRQGPASKKSEPHEDRSDGSR
jgi:hypothetical protein